MAQQAIEWAPFKLKPGVAEGSVMQASAEMQKHFLDRQPGFMRRELLKRGPGEFVDLVWWESREAAEAAMQVAGTSQACAGYFALMQFDTPPEGAVSDSGILHLAQLATYQRS
ncbi:antibiotic biosynthesis monooxygenase [Dongia sp.]|uniref:antibiotic biosynthesis monooxygenase family protein n=1 Tax=Dongia sp. TaxID=1977262 RepID=UPI0035B0CAA1